MLEITDLTEGTTAYYEFATTDTNGDGTINLLDVSDPTPASTVYTVPISILPNDGNAYCIKAMAHDASGIYPDSSIESACYGRLNAAATPTFNPAPADNFTSAQTLTITSATTGTTAHYEFATADTNGDGTINLLDVSDPTPASTVYTTPISILPNDGDAYCIKVIAHDAGGTYANSPVASGCYSRLPAASTPTFNPAPAGNFTTAQTLEITSPTTGTTARYEAATTDTDGDGDIDPDDVSIPTSTSTAYSAPLSILANDGDAYCIKAIAHDAGGTYANSPVVSACYGRLNAASTPTFNPAPAGNFTSAQTLTITSSTTGTTARYEAATTDTNGDGDIDPDDVSTPTSTSTAYSAPLSILPNEGDVYCIKVMAHDAGGTYVNSPVASGCYSRTLSAPGITAGGLYTSLAVTMTSAPGATIYYRAASDATTDLSAAIDPDDNTTYTGTGTSVTPTGFSSPGDIYRIKARAVSANGVLSPETAIQRYDYFDIDADNDGLIDIRTMEMFNNIRFNLAGTTYDDEAADSGTGDIGVTTGGPTSATTACPTDPDRDGVYLCGYELMADLNFAQGSSYASGTVNSTWCPNTSNNCIGSTSQAGFPGIGPATGTTSGFTGIFEGNDNSISNFYSRNTANFYNANIGLFALNEGGTIRNIAVEANLFGGTGLDFIGGLVGWNNSGTITASSASGSADGGEGHG